MLALAPPQARKSIRAARHLRRLAGAPTCMLGLAPKSSQRREIPGVHDAKSTGFLAFSYRGARDAFSEGLSRNVGVAKVSLKQSGLNR